MSGISILFGYVGFRIGVEIDPFRVMVKLDIQEGNSSTTLKVNLTGWWAQYILLKWWCQS